MARPIHLANAQGRDATVALERLVPPPGPPLGVPGKTIRFMRYLAATDDTRHEALVARLGAEYGEALVAGDPELSLELVGREVGPTTPVYLTSRGEVMYAPPQFVEVLYGPDGAERERRTPVDTEPNLVGEVPLRWTGRKLAIAEAARKFCFRRTWQVRHSDGVTFDFLHAMAKELADERAVVLLGGGLKGNEPLVFQFNGRPYRGFLEGRVNGATYALLLHLSDLELKRPVASEPRDAVPSAASVPSPTPVIDAAPAPEPSGPAEATAKRKPRAKKGS